MSEWVATILFEGRVMLFFLRVERVQICSFLLVSRPPMDTPNLVRRTRSWHPNRRVVRTGNPGNQETGQDRIRDEPHWNRHWNRPGPRVTGLPIRDCARGCNNCVHTRAQMHAIDVTKKHTIWAFVFGSRNGHIWALSQLSLMHPQLRPFTLQLFLDFRAKNFPEWPLIFLFTWPARDRWFWIHLEYCRNRCLSKAFSVFLRKFHCVNPFNSNFCEPGRAC